MTQVGERRQWENWPDWLEISPHEWYQLKNRSLWFMSFITKSKEKWGFLTRWQNQKQNITVSSHNYDPSSNNLLNLTSGSHRFKSHCADLQWGPEKYTRSKLQQKISKLEIHWKPGWVRCNEGLLQLLLLGVRDLSGQRVTCWKGAIRGQKRHPFWPISLRSVQKQVR